MTRSSNTTNQTSLHCTLWVFLAAIVLTILVASSRVGATDTLATIAPVAPSASNDSLCRVPRQLFLSTPFSLKESRSVFAIGGGWSGEKWTTRLEVGIMEDGLDPREPLSLDLTAGLYWKQNASTTVSIYEGIAITDQTGLYHSFDGHAVSMLILAGCEFRPDRSKYAFHVEAGTGGAFTPRWGSYRGGTVLSAGLRHYLGL
ncbi:MAG: hypothetical protein IPK50_06985 [Fibrobacterota bacterium]|nr:MAG: hypothetical protein IPK50_06985 [Fibrobacterota bacterium]